jgi:hypothetical protein
VFQSESSNCSVVHNLDIIWLWILLYQVYIKDTDERACAYIAGPAPNRWGFATEGKDLFNVIRSSSANGNSDLIVCAVCCTLSHESHVRLNRSLY